MPPTFPTFSLRATKDGIDQPTGDAAARPPMEILIQNKARAARCTMRVGRAQNTKSASGAANEDYLTHETCIPATPDQRIHQPTARENVSHRGKEPGRAGIEK